MTENSPKKTVVQLDLTTAYAVPCGAQSQMQKAKFNSIAMCVCIFCMWIFVVGLNLDWV